MSGDLSASAALAFGPFVLDLAAGRLRREGQPVDLPPRLWAVLVHLARRPGQLVGKDDLLDAIWGHRHVSESVLKSTINSLRGKLGDDAAAPLYIETVPRRGYRFVASVQSVLPVEPEAEAVLAPALATATESPAAQPPAAAGNLPAPGSPLIGREPALAELRPLFARQRLITLVGPGGVGKTQLALAAARLDPPPGGVWLVRLEALADATPLLDTVARALSLGANASRSVQALAQALAPLDVRIVLDNAEHLIEPVAELVAQGLAQAPRVQWLVTSQVPLRVAGEALLPLQPLAVPPAESTEALLNYPAAALFVARVRAVLPSFQAGTQEAADVGAVCRLLDGLPLAIELAAARVPLLGTAGVLARIGDRFALLSRGARDAAERHRTLRAALQWSFDLLDAPQRRVLRRLSVFSGTFTPGMAQVVAGDSRADEWAVLDALQALQDHSLLAIDPTAGDRRLRQLESVRALAAEELEAAGETAATRTRLAEAMADRFVEAQARFTRTPLLHWLAPLRPEADNLRLAMAHAAAGLVAAPVEREAALDPAALPLAVKLFSHAMLFWLRSGRKREAQHWFQILAPHAAQVTEPALRASWGLAVGALAAYGQSLPPAEGLPWLEESERIHAGMGDRRSANLAVYLIAALNQRVAPLADRTPLLQRMRSYEQADWSLRERNFSAWTEAVNAHGHGDLRSFRDFCVADLARARAADDRAEAWVAAFGLGQALWTLGERDRACRTLAEAVDDLRTSGLLREYATTAALGASMRLALTDAGSEPALREAADLLRAEGMLWWMGDALAMLPARRGDWAAALRLKRWIDDRMRTLGMQRSPVAASLKEDFDRLLAEARRAPAWGHADPAEGTPPAGSPLDDAEVLRLSFGPA